MNSKNNFGVSILAVFLFVIFLNTAFGGILNSFSQVKIVPQYSDVLQKLDLVLEFGGGRLIHMSDGSIWVVGVGMTGIKNPPSSTEILRQRTVAEQKARKAVAEQLHATEMSSLTKSLSVDLHTSRGSQDQSDIIESYEESIEAKVVGVVRNLQLAGTWHSADGQFFYLALCSRLK